jgi:hypothetical protein
MCSSSLIDQWPIHAQYFEFHGQISTCEHVLIIKNPSATLKTVCPVHMTFYRQLFSPTGKSRSSHFFVSFLPFKSNNVRLGLHYHCKHDENSSAHFFLAHLVSFSRNHSICRAAAFKISAHERNYQDNPIFPDLLIYIQSHKRLIKDTDRLYHTQLSKIASYEQHGLI